MVEKTYEGYPQQPAPEEPPLSTEIDLDRAAGNNSISVSLLAAEYKPTYYPSPEEMYEDLIDLNKIPIVDYDPDNVIKIIYHENKHLSLGDPQNSHHIYGHQLYLINALLLSRDQFKTIDELMSAGFKGSRSYFFLTLSDLKSAMEARGLPQENFIFSEPTVNGNILQLNPNLQFNYEIDVPLSPPEAIEEKLIQALEASIPKLVNVLSRRDKVPEIERQKAFRNLAGKENLRL